jgi:KUP system potassium uptake protein
MLLAETPSHAVQTVQNPFFYMAPDALRLPLVILVTVATIIASQAVISGAFSVTQQAIQLGFVPRLRIAHTSESAAGQIYIPIVNWALLVMVILLVLFFQTSSNLAAAYGIAVTGAMLIDGVLITVVLLMMWKWPVWLSIPLLVVFFTVDLLYFSANLLKVPQGGWFPLVVAAIAFTLLTTWAKGRQLMIARLNEMSLPMKVFVKSAVPSATRVPGTAVFMTSSENGVPPALLHNLKHNKILHERVFLLTIKIEDVPYVKAEKRSSVQDFSHGFWRIVLRYGFMEEIDVPAALAKIQECGPTCKPMDTSYFLSRQTLLTSARPAMAVWREKLFAWMMRNAETAMEFFKLPTNRVVELGSQVEI